MSNILKEFLSYLHRAFVIYFYTFSGTRVEKFIMFSLKNQRLLVVAPHPDDEVLGCAGLIKRVKDEGGKVYIVFMVAGDTKEYSQHGVTTTLERISEIEKAAKFLQYDDYKVVFVGETYHLKLDQIPQKDIIDELENGKQISFNKTKPTIVVTPYICDYNQDHRSITEAVFSATRPLPDDQKPLQKIVLGSEPVMTADWWAESSRQLNFFISLSEKDLDTKIKALSLYESQIRNGAHPRSLESLRTLAKFRGIQSGCFAAEAFHVYRYII